MLNERISLFAEREFAYGGTQDSSNTRVGLRSNPWSLATINTSVEQQVTENGPRLFSNLGLTQGYAVNEHLLLDFGIDRTQILKDSGTTAFNPAAPPSNGTLDGSFTAVYAGSSYARDLWSATSRLEYRHDINALWDIGLQGSMLYSSNSNTLLYSAGPSVGVNLFKNLWFSAGYNFAGYRDRDFTAAGYTARGPYAKLRFKFDSGTTKDVAAWWDKTRNSLAGGRIADPDDS